MRPWWRDEQLLFAVLCVVLLGCLWLGPGLLAGRGH
jgi:hypothetical protein